MNLVPRAETYIQSCSGMGDDRVSVPQRDCYFDTWNYKFQRVHPVQLRDPLEKHERIFLPENLYN